MDSARRIPFRLHVIARCAALTVVCMALSAPAVAPNAPLAGPVPTVGLNERDYSGQGNVTATNRVWFYLNTDHSTRLQGGGVFNSLEFDADRGWQIPAVVYVRNNSIVLSLKFVNASFQDHTMSLVVNGVRLRIPPTSGGGSPTYVDLSGGGPYSLSMTANGGSDTATLTLSGMPNYVTRGALQVDLQGWENGVPIYTTGGWTTWEAV